MDKHRYQRMGLMVVMLSISLLSMPMAARALDVGDKAPDFVMHSTVGESVKLSDYQGKKNVFLFFFLAAFSAA
jgi:peroxiredoxin